MVCVVGKIDVGMVIWKHIVMWVPSCLVGFLWKPALHVFAFLWNAFSVTVYSDSTAGNCWVNNVLEVDNVDQSIPWLGIRKCRCFAETYCAFYSQMNIFVSRAIARIAAKLMLEKLCNSNCPSVKWCLCLQHITKGCYRGETGCAAEAHVHIEPAIRLTDLGAVVMIKLCDRLVQIAASWSLNMEYL